MTDTNTTTNVTDSTTPVPAQSLADAQAALTTLVQVGQAAASPFIHSPAGQQKAAIVAGEVNLGIAALPLLAQLFQTISHLFNHTHAMATKPTSTAQLGAGLTPPTTQP